MWHHIAMISIDYSIKLEHVNNIILRTVFNKNDQITIICQSG